MIGGTGENRLPFTCSVDASLAAYDRKSSGASPSVARWAATFFSYSRWTCWPYAADSASASDSAVDSFAISVRDSSRRNGDPASS